MIILKQKPFEELLRELEGETNVFLAGCADCATTCKVGGEEEIDALERKLTEHGKTVTGKHIFDTACLAGSVRDGVKQHAEAIEAADSILVMACGTGVQSIGDQLEDKQVHPGAESLFVGEVARLGKYAEKCTLCNDCVLELTDGICPVTRCSKGLVNGPCGGYSEEGKCEVDPDKDCAWVLIYKRLQKRGHLHKMKEIRPPHDYSSHHHPRSYQWEKRRPPKKEPAVP